MRSFHQFTEAVKVFPPVNADWTRRGFYNDAEQAADFAVAETKRTKNQHMVSSEMGTLCPNCAPSWVDDPDRLTLTVEPGHLDQCYNCHADDAK